MPPGVGRVWDDGAVQVNDWLVSVATPDQRVHPDELGALRSALDADAATVFGAAAPPVAGELVTLSKSRLAQLDRCERSAVASATVVAPSDPPSPAALAGRALDHFVAQVLVGGRLGESAHDLRAALVAHGDHEALARLAEWEGNAEGAEFDRRVDGLAAAVFDSWRGVDPSWAPRTQTSVALVLAGGRLRVSGVVDVELGGDHTIRPGVVVEVKSGRAVEGHRHETYLYALLVALRDGAAPAAVASWYPGGAPAGTPVTIGMLEAAAERLLAGVRQWVGLLGGEDPTASPGPWCAWCPVRADCDVALVPDDGTSVVPAGDAAEAECAPEVEYTPEVEGEERW